MIAVTGVNGLVGGNLARALRARGESVRGIIHHDRKAVEGLDIELVQADLLDSPALIRAFNGVEVVFHLAGFISLSEQNAAHMEDINIEGVRNVIAACQVCRVRRLVHFSSIEALIQEPFETPVDEERPLATGPHYPLYNRTKAAGEALVRQAEGLETVILNPTGILGPYDFRPSFFGQALLLMAAGRLPVMVSGGFDWVDVRDVVNAAIQAARSAPAGSRFLLSSHWVSAVDVARAVARLSGFNPPRFSVPISLAYHAAPLVALFARLSGSPPLYTRDSLGALRSNHRISHARAAQMLGYQPRPFEESLQDTLDWFAANGYLRRKAA